MELINLTPHNITLLDENGEAVLVLESAGVARARAFDTPAADLEVGGVTVPTVTTEFGEVTDLPDPTPGVAYVVSSLTAQAAARGGRTTEDLFLPSGLVRDESGQPKGCRALARI